MELAWGLIVLVLSLIAWLGQAVATLSPATGVRLTLIEAEADVEPVYWADIRGEAAWDALTLWTLPLAGILLVAGEPTWAVFGLIGGGAYLYFAGRGIFVRTMMLRGGFRVGSPASVRIGLAFLAIWGAMSVVTIIAAAASLEIL